MADAANALDGLKEFEASLIYNGWSEAAMLRDAIALIESQAAELKEQAAEIERLTPKPMTLEEACEVLSRHKFLGNSDWDSNGEFVFTASGKHTFGMQIGVAVAHWLEITKEAARA